MSVEFAGIDWGTSSFRLWHFGRDGKVLAESRSAEGMVFCQTTGFSTVLADHLARISVPSHLPILICGMAGARQGWFEAPYVDLPARITTLAASAVRLPDEAAAGRDIRILPGLAQRDPSCPDVMRGEETQLSGLVKDKLQGLVCLPGTHCKWAWLQDGAVTGFTSFITGELFDVLSRHSVLRHAMPERGKVAADSPAFLDALREAMLDPAKVLSALFGLRAAHLLGYRDDADTQARLSGLLIGAEVALATRQVQTNRVILVGQDGLGALYAAALVHSGLNVEVVDAEKASRQGLRAAAQEIWAV